MLALLGSPRRVAVPSRWREHTGSGTCCASLLRFSPIARMRSARRSRERVSFWGFDGLHSHDLRHDGVSRLFEMGSTISQAASVSGQRSWSSLKRYDIRDKPATNTPGRCGWKWSRRLLHRAAVRWPCAHESALFARRTRGRACCRFASSARTLKRSDSVNFCLSRAFKGMTQTQSADHPTILVAEDDVLLRLHASELLEESGYTVVEADSAEEALKVMEARKDIRLLFTDIQMPPGCDGLELARQVHERWPSVLLVITPRAR
jgi:CheY-like chemotaxis protein